jgi:hypothetical protein
VGSLSLPAVILTKCSYFDTPTGGWPAGAKRDIKANSAERKLELGLILAKLSMQLSKYMTKHKQYNPAVWQCLIRPS